MRTQCFAVSPVPALRGAARNLVHTSVLSDLRSPRPWVRPKKGRGTSPTFTSGPAPTGATLAAGPAAASGSGPATDTIGTTLGGLEDQLRLFVAFDAG
jgi:hypothetical protein